jgi:putative transposase
VIVEGDGRTLGVAFAGANVHDAKLLKRNIEAIVVDRPEPFPRKPQQLCEDKAYDNSTAHAVAVATDYTPHVRRIGEEKLHRKGRKRHPASRSDV